jgi:hypothetical protein
MERFDLETALKELDLPEWTPDAIEKRKRTELENAPPQTTSRWLQKIERESAKWQELSVGSFRFWGNFPKRLETLLDKVEAFEEMNGYEITCTVHMLKQHDRKTDRDEVLCAMLKIDGRYVGVWNKNELVLPPGVQLLEESKRVITVNCSLRFHEMLRASGYRREDTSMKEQRFPIDPSLSGRYIWRIYEAPSDECEIEDVIALMRHDGFEPARHEHGFAFMAQFPNWNPENDMACLGTMRTGETGHRDVFCFRTVWRKLITEEMCDYGLMTRNAWSFLAVKRIR